jgi:hypothetical protein
MRTCLSILALLSLPAFAQSKGMQPQTMKPQAEAPPAGGASVAPPAAPAAAAPTQPNVLYLPGAPAPAAQPQAQKALPFDPMALLNAFKGAMQKGGPTADTDWSTYEYPDDYKFSSGQQGAKNIGSGLCIAMNANRTQGKEGLCAILGSILAREDSCAHKAMKRILAKADSGGIQGFGRYCSTYGSLPDHPGEKEGVILQVLSTLIVQESGWNKDVREKEWTKNGQPMGGKGLFQIGVNDRSKEDCEGINATSIFNPTVNLKCGACIALSNLDLDSTMGHGVGDNPKAPNGAKGMARYFGPLRDGQAGKARDMANAVDTYCKARAGKGGDAHQFAPLTSGGGQQSGGSSSPASSGAVKE